MDPVPVLCLAWCLFAALYIKGDDLFFYFYIFKNNNVDLTRMLKLACDM